MKRISALIIILFITTSISVEAKGVTVYETVNSLSEYGGAWDANIFADDVHFHHGGIITNVMMKLAIKGNQQNCRFWIFDRLGSDAIYSVPFSNAPSSNQTDFLEYNFPMQLSVPKDIYIGFSAEGDGWDAELMDCAELAPTVSNGVANGEGFYWWGTAEEGQLIQGANFNSGDYFRLKVDMLQPAITTFAVRNNDAVLQITNISGYATYLIERSFNLNSNQWEIAGEFSTNNITAAWSETPRNEWQSVLYRIRVKHEE